MNYKLTKDVIHLLEKFDSENKNNLYTADIEGFKSWISDNHSATTSDNTIYWDGKENGRSAESAISTLLVHLNRYAKTYSKSAIFDSEFSTQEEFIYLINLKSFGEMSKTELIKRNVQEKPVGILTINRLINQKWVLQKDSDIDKRTKIISITQKGLDVLEKQMNNIRKATRIVSGNLTNSEKNELIRLLNKLDHFHSEIFGRNIDTKNLIETVYSEYSFNNN
ncbi:MarR family winged helix-turn-helix transcriptional regulator [Chryseobacterium oryzae]|uniref:MarR family winged helix-turn-helix transcriptional regulator n=1 Tax=Chryseobacterium oryzae TaxID=2929799 RepID=A0ABY4BRW9_9FLAO|nr:MarR family winged helix-turn-helix transcriptional regulator [Chryseobacterium oryzae]UOE39310.1 MarR family winged helix-turn-helix transcriptional regulator [Chryseobacterium oryzae]